MTALLRLGLCLVGAGAALAQRPELQDFSGHAVSFAAVSGATTVVAFISSECPVSNQYNTRMADLFQEFTPKGVRFVFVNANHNESPAQIQNHARQAGFPFPVYRDGTGDFARSFDAQVTPEVFVLDSTGKVVYHGGIDDSRNPARVRRKALELALMAILSGEPPDRVETRAFGCSIKLARRME